MVFSYQYVIQTSSLVNSTAIHVVGNVNILANVLLKGNLNAIHTELKKLHKSTDIQYT